MKISPGKISQSAKNITAESDLIAEYAQSQSLEYAAVCNTLRTAIDEALPMAESKIWHSMPVWFIGENPVVGYKLTAKKGINLMFWSGQDFAEPGLLATGKFKAAQTQFSCVADIDQETLRRWLKKASENIWDYHGYYSAQKAGSK